MKTNYTLNQIRQAAAKVVLVPVALSALTVQLSGFAQTNPAAASAHQAPANSNRTAGRPSAPAGRSAAPASRPAASQPSAPAARPAASASRPAAPAARPAAPTSTSTARPASSAPAAGRPGWNAPKTAASSTPKTSPTNSPRPTDALKPSTSTDQNTNINRNANTPGAKSASSNSTNSSTNVTKNITINKNVNVNQNTNVNRNSSSKPGTYVNKYGGPRQETPGRGPVRLAGGPHGGDVIRHHRIPEQRFHASFGRSHEFHLRRTTLIGSAPIFHYGGIGFRMGRPWPATWLETDPLYVDVVGGSYYLCNRLRPEARVLVNVAECDTCQVVETPAPCDTCGPEAAAPAPECTECARQAAPDAPPTLTRGMTIGQVVAVLGNPKEIVDLGVRKIYLYDNMRVTFFGGRMSDVR